MAFANNINRDMTAADARAVAGQHSWSDVFPEGFDFEEENPTEYVGRHRLWYDTHGNPHFVRGGNPFSGDLATRITAGEKDGILARKMAGELDGKIRDTTSRYGPPKEWDHVVIGLSREEAVALGEEGVQEWFRVVAEAMQESPAGDGKRQMIATPIHDDTDKLHMQFLLHRIPVDEVSKMVGASFELSRNSEAAAQMKQVNTALDAAGLPMIADFRVGAYSVTETRTLAPEDLDRAAERVRDAGGVTPPDLTSGPLPARQRVTPEMKHIDEMYRQANQRLKEAEAAATAAATAVAAVQHAKEALAQYEEASRALEQTTRERDALAAELEDVKAGHQATIDDLAATKLTLEETTEERDALAAELTEEQKTTKDQATEIESLKTERDDLSKRLEDLEKKFDGLHAELVEERESFTERARVWAEENLVSPIRKELAEAKEQIRQQFEAMAAMREAFSSRQQPQRRNVPDWVKKSPNDWTKKDREAASKSLKTQQDQGKLEGVTVEEYGEVQHQRFRNSQQNDDPDGSNKPKP